MTASIKNIMAALFVVKKLPELLKGKNSNIKTIKKGIEKNFRFALELYL